MSTKQTRRKFTAAFKTKVAIEAIKEQHTLSELASKFNLHPNQISKWKREFLNNADTVFSSKSSNTKEDNSEEQIGTLYQKIGKLEMENDYLKKSLWKTGL